MRVWVNNEKLEIDRERDTERKRRGKERKIPKTDRQRGLEVMGRREEIKN